MTVQSKEDGTTFDFIKYGRIVARKVGTEKDDMVGALVGDEVDRREGLMVGVNVEGNADGDAVNVSDDR